MAPKRQTLLVEDSIEDGVPDPEIPREDRNLPGHPRPGRHRREAHRISRAALAEVPTVLTYETGTSTAEFAPTRFLDVEAFMEKKLEVLTAYLDQARPDLDAGYIQAAARHWGRNVKFGWAEAFEVMRDQGKDS
ncbi:MAG: hypothetical protein EXR95_08035 [Gemmatimonadetes bacterium]|nr:hypothetical protein [Gemmatimonadota bacterium]